MNAHLAFGFVSIPAPVASGGPLADFLNRGGRVTYTVPGWFCRGCRGATAQGYGVMVATRDHAKCAAAFGEEKS